MIQNTKKPQWPEQSYSPVMEFLDFIDVIDVLIAETEDLEFFAEAGDLLQQHKI